MRLRAALISFLAKSPPVYSAAVWFDIKKATQLQRSQPKDPLELFKIIEYL